MLNETSFYTQDELMSIGFKKIGENVLISRFARIYNSQNISLGNNVRIDDFCILSAGLKGIEIGSYVHIAAYASLIGKELIKIGNYCGVSARSAIYSSNDDYSGNFLFGPTVDTKLKNVEHGAVVIQDYCIVGANTIILPNVTIHEGTAVGAMSLVKNNLEAWSIYAGNPAKKIKNRAKGLLNLINP